MVKKSINLLIEKELDSLLVAKLKHYLPVAAAVCFILFIILFIVSITITKKNLAQYNTLKEEVNKIENKIDEKQNLEGVYTLSYSILKIINEITGNKVNFTPLLASVIKINSDDLSLTKAMSDDKGLVNFSISASSSAALNNLVSFLHEREDKDKIFSAIYAHRATRNTDGGYQISVSFKADESLYHEKTN
ncbi:hypothetical protein A3D03_04000 [Candidatus Gottesmanbacteria bacterium RIFCSPHIGHO2_02_FULL_40_13]|uniref:PilN domain-containing protein n=1 Tax=Candidatus Gottesmanbacteria bacterium RIFCSPHIGHO2_02_FULL_40_13 TaxID=1798384 RepID=A0A1F6A7Y8_9BACT|nr:MAG: hypothetical protein A3D03_04000 [Candidatus Gottesmanbacteria bacterium RIFCSPHIGHO2_02_FULL_40_13]